MPTASPATVAQFKTLFPAFCALADEQISEWFTQAAFKFNSARFGAQWHMAVYYFTAHQLTIFGTPNKAGTGEVASSTDAKGATTSEKVGDLSKNYGSAMDAAKVPASLHGYLRTAYGVELIQIIMSRSVSYGGVIRTGSSRVGAVQGVFSTDESA